MSLADKTAIAACSLLLQLRWVFCFCAAAAGSCSTRGADHPYLEFVRAQAAELRAAEPPVTSKAEWTQKEAVLRREFLQAWGGLPLEKAPLNPQVLGQFKREGYRVEKVIFQTMPGVWMTANTYVPDLPGKRPAILMVHGHWRGAKQDPVVQARCIGAAKLGFFVLAVDAFGAGERSVGKALGEYHGDMTAATLLPIGLPLFGLQVIENMRALDYLQTREEVDGTRIGISGASGGGNQTMYAGAWDPRFAAVAPVCSVGNYQAYLGAACCMCEVVPGALRFTEEWALLALTAPRACLVINATRDARQFSPAEAEKSVSLARPVFELLGSEEKLRHMIFESGHDYSRPMREAVYGWMKAHLNGEGSGVPAPEPEVQTEDPETLRCFPGEARPEGWLTIPKWAAREGRRLLEKRPPPGSAELWQLEQENRRRNLVRLLGGWPRVAQLNLISKATPDGREITFQSEPGITLQASYVAGESKDELVLVLDLEGAEQARRSEFYRHAKEKGATLVTLDLRATGKLAWNGDRIGRAPDHTTAQWGLWIGRPLLGQWVWDVRRLLDAVRTAEGSLPEKITVAGMGPAGQAALAAAALDDRINRTIIFGSLASWVSETPYEGQRLGTIVPGIMRDIGDVGHLAAMIAPRILEVQGGVNGAGEKLSALQLTEAFEYTATIFRLLEAESAFHLAEQ